MLSAMIPPLPMRSVTDEERAALEAGLRSHEACTVRHAFDARGLACVQRGSTVPRPVEPVLHAEKRAPLRAILHPSPRTFGQPASVWTLKRLAEVWHEQGLSDPTLSCPTMLDAIVRLGVSWQRAKPWLVSPDPAYEREKTPGPTAPDGRPPSGHRAGLRR
jgi:hypothetical protein